MTGALDRRSLSDQIKDRLIDAITSGRLKPGDRLVEVKIAEDMQTSQAPVREALRALDSLGLIEMRRNRGAMVRAFGETELRNINAVRAELEGLAAEIAAKDQGDIASELLELCEQMSVSVAKGNKDEFVDLNDRFHRTIVEASANDVLIDMWNTLEIRARTAVNVARSKRPLEVAVQEHFAIARGIQNKDAGAARRNMTKHISSVVDVANFHTER